MSKHKIPRLPTGVPNLDLILGGGWPKRSVTVFGGTPGSGKTILSQQTGFHNASPDSKAVFFQTLSEPTAKTLTYVSQFDFFDEKKVGKTVHFVDLGDIIRTKGTKPAVALLLSHLKRIKPSIVVIDSFKAFDDLAGTREELRKFTYEVAIHLMAWECTSLLLGEFDPRDIANSPLFSVVDGIVYLSQRKESGEQQRYLQVMKMRGTNHSRLEHVIEISEQGIELYAPRFTIQKAAAAPVPAGKPMKTGIRSLDALLPGGIPRGSSCLVSGAAGTGKSVLGLEFLYRGAKEHGEKGILFHFDENEAQVIDAASRLGWDFQALIDEGLLELVFIPQPTIQIEPDVATIQEKIRSSGAKRVVFDSVSLFLFKVTDPIVMQEKIFQLTTLVRSAGAVGLFLSDIPSVSTGMSRSGVEEMVLDGIFLLRAERVQSERKRSFEIYKMRNVAHTEGLRPMTISSKGIQIE